MMKKYLALLSLLIMFGCSSPSSNKINQNLIPLPQGSTSYQCDSGKRIIVSQTQDKLIELLYQSESYRLTPSEKNTWQNQKFQWVNNGLNASLFNVKNSKSERQIEQCTQVLK